jgi:hypothetical protein
MDIVKSKPMFVLALEETLKRNAKEEDEEEYEDKSKSEDCDIDEWYLVKVWRT